MPIRVQCTSCKTALAVKDHLAGKRIKCPKCQTPLLVPGVAAGAPLPVNKPAASKAKAPVKPKVPIGQPADLEAEALAALRGDAPPDAPGSNGANGHGPSGAAATNGAANGTNGHPPDAAKPPIKFACEYCEAEIEIEASLAGKKAPCPECRRIIKVPAAKEEKVPTDWRKVQNKGPALAAVNQPQKIENAWGTEKKSKVSDKALLEAGIIEKPKAPSIGMAGWIARIVKVGLVVLVAGGVGMVVWNLKRTSDGARELEVLAKTMDPTWPPIIQAEFHVVVADIALKQPKQRELAREHYIQAWQKATASAELSDKVDRDFFLVKLAQAQLKLGGDEMDIREQSRFDWDQKVFEEVQRTVNRIENPDAHVEALRQLVPAFADKKKPELAVGLVGMLKNKSPQNTAFHIALLVGDLDKKTEAKQIAPEPQAGKPGDLVARCGYAEGYAREFVRKGDDTLVKKAMEIAERPGETSHRVQALVAVASSLALDPKGDKAEHVRNACESARKLLEKDAKANVPPWVLLQHVRLTARYGDAEPDKAIEQATKLAKKLPAHYQRRAQLEIALVALEQPTATAAVVEGLDKSGPGHGLGWLTLAQTKARANLPFAFNPESSEDEALRPFFRALDAFAATK